MSLFHSFTWIFLSTLIISGSATFFWFYYKQQREQLMDTQEYTIRSIVQRSSEKEPLKTAYFAELLDLSVDQERNIYRFDLERGQEKLLRSPLIAKAEIEMKPPHTLLLTYKLRTPKLILETIENAAIDQEGVLIPLSPFFSPKNLPKIRLEHSKNTSLKWGDSLAQNSLSFVFSFLAKLEENSILDRMEVICIDISHLESPSKGSRELILKIIDKTPNLREKGGERLLRLSAESSFEGVQSYLSLQEYLESQETTLNPDIIDLRIKNLAFL